MLFPSVPIRAIRGQKNFRPGTGDGSSLHFVTAQMMRKALHITELHAALRKVCISGVSLDSVFTRSNRRNCWLTFAALRMDSFSAIHSCETVVTW
jgi:hypothetical protein